MPRVLPAESTTAAAAAAAATTPIAPKAPKQRGGNVLIGFGWFLLGLMAVDQGLQYTDRQHAQSTINELRQAEEEARRVFFEQHKELPVLYEAVVKFEYKMSGTRGLKGVKLYDRLQVLEEGVGPNGTYATCRRIDANTGEITSIGWYPLSFMEKVEKPRKKFLGLF